jgi:catechol 2,3-dioxygenase-like lactoylglutathione lyase family enzyme
MTRGEPSECLALCDGSVPHRRQGGEVTIRRVVPNISSPDLDTSREFYCDLLGFEVVMDLGWIVTYASPTNATAQISISPGHALTGEQMRPYLTIEVDDVDATHAKAVERGYDVVHPLTDEAWRVRRFFVVEPGGLVLNILGHTPLGDGA